MPELNLTPAGFDYHYVGRPDRNIKGGIKKVTSMLDDAEEHRMCQIDSGRLGEIDREIEHCTGAITLNPNDAKAYNNRGVAYNIKGDFNRAIQNFNTVIRLKPDNADTYYNRGLAYGQEPDVDRAVQDFSQMIKLTPDDAEAYNNRGAAYAKKGNLDCALEDFTKAIEYKTSEVRFYSNRGMAYYSKEEYDLARKDFGKVIELKLDCLADLIQKSGIKPPEDVAAMLTPLQAWTLTFWRVRSTMRSGNKGAVVSEYSVVIGEWKMAWIRTVDDVNAAGIVKEEYDAAIARAGRVYNIVKLFSARPKSMRAFIELYKIVMHDEESPLSRMQREMIATVVSKVNECRYWVISHADELREQLTDKQIAQIVADFHTADIDETTKAILEFAIKVTKAAPTVTPADLEHLRGFGLSDEALFAIVEVVGFFNYVNRIADAFGVELDDFLEGKDFGEPNK